MSKKCTSCYRRLCNIQFVWADRHGNDKNHKQCKYCKMNRERWRQKNMTKIMIDNSRYKDSGKKIQEGRKPKDFTWEEKDYITTGYIDLLRTFQDDRCAYCNILMQTLNRNLADGLTLEALDNTKPHVRSNCCLACKLCNSRRVGQTNMKVGEAVGLKHLAAGLENLYQHPKTSKGCPGPCQSGSTSGESFSEDRIPLSRKTRHRKDRRTASYVVCT